MFVTARTVPAERVDRGATGIARWGIATLSAGVVAILVGLDQGVADG